jgi:hypothetical protein
VGGDQRERLAGIVSVFGVRAGARLDSAWAVVEMVALEEEAAAVVVLEEEAVGF